MFWQVFIRSTTCRLNSTVCRRHFAFFAICSPPFDAKCVYSECLTLGVQSITPSSTQHASIVKIGESLDASQVIYGFLRTAAGRTRQSAIQRFAAHHGSHSGPQTHPPRGGLQRTRCARRPGLAGRPPRLADARMAQSEGRSRRTGVHEGASGGAPGCRRKLRARPALHFARAAPPLLYPSRPAGRALLAALLRTGPEFLGKERLQGCCRMARSA